MVAGVSARTEGGAVVTMKSWQMETFLCMILILTANC